MPNHTSTVLTNPPPAGHELLTKATTSSHPFLCSSYTFPLQTCPPQLDLLQNPVLPSREQLSPTALPAPPLVPTQLTPNQDLQSLQPDRDSSSCWLLAGARSFLHTPGCCSSCICWFAPHRGSCSSPSPAAIPGLCPVTAEQGWSHSVPQSKQHHFIPFLLLCTKYITEDSIINSTHLPCLLCHTKQLINEKQL